MADLRLYSQAKAAHHPERLAVLRAGAIPRPIHVQLILSDLCNQDCGFCAYRMSAGLTTELFKTAETHNPNRRIPTLKALEILDDCATLGVKAVQFTGGGEPTVHPDHLSLFAQAQTLGMETALVTNGVKLDPLADGVQRMTWIRVSMDAGTEETYVRVRRTPRGHWAKAWANVRALAASPYGGALGMGFVVTPENYSELPACARLARDAGVHNLRISAVFSALGTSYYADEDLPKIRAAVAEAVAAGTPEFVVHDLFERRTEDLIAGHPTDPECRYQYLTVYIGGDLNVYRCCSTAYTAIGKVASLADQRLRDLDLEAIYRPFDARACRFCQFRGQNAVLSALAAQPDGDDPGPPPQHVNFV